MSNYCNTSKYVLRYTEFDFKDEMRASAILGLTQEAASRSADDLGFGYDDLRPLHYGFVIVNTYCKLHRPIRLSEDVTIETWPLPPRHVFFERDYRLLVGEEEVAAVASRWCLVDLATFSLLSPEKLGEKHEKCPYRNEKTVETPSWKIPRIKAGREMYRMQVWNSHCDHYIHANNAQYADFFFNCFRMEELAARPVTAFQIAYVKQAKEGSELVLTREDIEGGALCEAHLGDDLIAQFRVWWGEEA